MLLECDVKSCHRQCKLHPDIAGGFSFIVGQLLYVPVGNVFGGVTSASSWEPFRRAIIALARKYWSDDTLVAKHRKFLDMLRWDIQNDESQLDLVQAIPDAFNKGVLDEQGNRLPTESEVFVDDLLLAEVHEYMERALAAALKAIFTLLGQPEPLLRNIAVAMDKFEDMLVSHCRMRLGLQCNTRRMVVSIPVTYVAEVLVIIKKLHNKDW